MDDQEGRNSSLRVRSPRGFPAPMEVGALYLKARLSLLSIPSRRRNKLRDRRARRPLDCCFDAFSVTRTGIHFARKRYGDTRHALV
jgi:hypothetical protein